jgi:hypothetical protein
VTIPHLLYHDYFGSEVQSDSKVLSGFPFIGHGKLDKNLESSCTFDIRIYYVTGLALVRALSDFLHIHDFK